LDSVLAAPPDALAIGSEGGGLVSISVGTRRTGSERRRTLTLIRFVKSQTSSSVVKALSSRGCMMPAFWRGGRESGVSLEKMKPWSRRVRGARSEEGEKNAEEFDQLGLQYEGSCGDKAKSESVR
jgi:hypothetical protein